MSFGLNRAEVIGRLGADVTINHLASGGRVANLSIATDESYIDRQSGDRIVNRHSILTPNRRAKLTPLSDTAEVVPVVNRGDPRGFV